MVLVSAFEFYIQNISNLYLPYNFKVSKFFLNKKSCKNMFKYAHLFENIKIIKKGFLLNQYT